MPRRLPAQRRPDDELVGPGAGVDLATLVEVGDAHFQD